MLTIITMITALAGGATISAVLAGLSITDWICIVGVLLTVGEDGVKLFAALHPALKVIEDDIKRKLDAEEIAYHAVNLRF